MKLISFAVLLCLLHSGCAKTSPNERAWSRHIKAVQKANKRAAAKAAENAPEEQ
jgi:hypothetical protein